MSHMHSEAIVNGQTVRARKPSFRPMTIGNPLQNAKTIAILYGRLVC